MKNALLFTLLAAVGSLALTACEDDKPEPVRRETTVVHHYHARDRSRASTDNPNDFEPVERPASYSR